MQTANTVARVAYCKWKRPVRFLNHSSHRTSDCFNNCAVTCQKRFPTRRPRHVFRSSARKHGMNKQIILNYRERFQISLEIWQSFSSINWQYWGNISALLTSLFPLVGASRDTNNCFGCTFMTKKSMVTLLGLVVVTV